MNCVLITLTFPYGIGDRFLKEEIPVIAKEFEHIYILPIVKMEGDRINLPSNVELIQSQTNITLAMIKTILHAKSIIAEVLFGLRTSNTSWSKVIHRVVMYEYNCNLLIDALDSIDNTNCVFYAYWLSEPAYLLARYKMNNPKSICISRAHGYDCFKDRGYNPYRREIAEQLDCIYSISQMGKNDLEKNLVPLARNNHHVKIKTAHLGINTVTAMNPVKEDGRLFRIVSCSNVLQVKRLDILFEALSFIHNTEKKIEWIHFGDGELLDTMKEKTAEYKKREDIHIVFNGLTAHEEVLKYYSENHIDLFINCSDAEGIPVSIMEAMEYGIPCIARNVGGISDLIDNNINGFLLPKEITPKVLAVKIEEIIHSGVNNIIRENAKKKIEKHFSCQENYRIFANELMTLKQICE